MGGQWPFTSRARLKRACMVVIAPRGAKRSGEDHAIKGPGIRLDLDVRRVWRCPSCQRVLKTAGHITSRTCPIDGAWMQLDDSAQRAAGRLNFPSIDVEDDDAPDRLEDASTEATYDGDDDRPRKQSRKQTRRRRRKSDETVSEQGPEQEPGTDGSESVT